MPVFRSEKASSLRRSVKKALREMTGNVLTRPGCEKEWRD